MSAVQAEEKRAAHRRRPRGLVSLAIFQGATVPPAYGIVGDISERGVRVHSDRILARGQPLRLCIQFESEPELFETAGHVAWTRPADEGDDLVGGAVSGIALELPSLQAEFWLRRLLTAPPFDERDGSSRHYDDLVSALGPDLDRVGDYLVALGMLAPKR